MSDALFTPRETCAFLETLGHKVSEKTLANWRASGMGPRFYTGPKFLPNPIRYRKVMLEKWHQEIKATRAEALAVRAARIDAARIKRSAA